MRRIVSLLLAVILLVDSLVAGEVLAALFYKKTFSVVNWGLDIQPDDDLVYSFRPNLDILWHRRDAEMKFHTNNLGFRSETDVEIPKPSETFRILMAGDSFVFGDSLSDSETIPSVIQQKLTETETANKRIEVINMGVPGYSPDQTYRQLMKYIPMLQPDLVVWGFISWHINGMVNTGGRQYYRPSLYGLRHGALVHLDARFNKVYVHNWLLSSAPQMIRRTYLFDLMLNRLFYSPFFSNIPNASRKDKLIWAQKKLSLEIQSVRARAEENGSSFMFAVLPTLDGSSMTTNGELIKFLDGVKEQVSTYSPIVFVDISRELLAYQADASGQDPNDPEFVLGAIQESPTAWFFDGANEHPNSYGALIFSDVLSRYIRQAM